MNLQLLDPFEHPLPDINEAVIPDTYARNLSFNRRGNLLASGCTDGRCIIWDFDTKGPAMNLCGHVKEVTSVSWSRNGRFLLSSSLDWNCIYWDLMTARKKHIIQFSSPVVFAQMHPRNNSIFVACPLAEPPTIVNLETQERWSLPLPSTLDFSIVTSTRESDYIMTASWDRKGEHVYIGSPRGHLYVVDYKSQSIVFENKLGSSSIRGISFSRSGRDLVVNLSDRTIRVFYIPEPETRQTCTISPSTHPTHSDVESRLPVNKFLSEETYPEPIAVHKLQDLVNRHQWVSACFNADGEYVVAGSESHAQHCIYIWDKNVGNLIKILEGPKESLADICWHPHRPIVGSVTHNGNIYIWGTSFTENWSAFAPDFKHLEENVVYMEREDEFDLPTTPPPVGCDSKVAGEAKEDEREHDIEIDVMTVECVNPFGESDSELECDEDEHGKLFVLPLQIETDDKGEQLAEWVKGRVLTEEVVNVFNDLKASIRGQTKGFIKGSRSRGEGGQRGVEVEQSKKKKKRKKKSLNMDEFFQKTGYVDPLQELGYAVANKKMAKSKQLKV